MSRIQNLFLLLIVIGPLHMAEQLVTSIEEFYSIQHFFAGYYAWFPPAAADRASVILITIIWTICSVLLYAVLRDALAADEVKKHFSGPVLIAKDLKEF